MPYWGRHFCEATILANPTMGWDPFLSRITDLIRLRFLKMKEKFLMKNFRNYFTPLWAVLSIRSVPSQQVSGGIFACVQIIGHHSITFCCILLLWHSDRIPTIITMGSNLFCRSIHNFMHLRFPEYFNQISYSITVWIWDLLMLSGDFVHLRKSSDDMNKSLGNNI